MRPTIEKQYNRYLYIIKNPLWIKALYSFGILSWLLTVFAFSKFLNLNIVYWFIFGPMLAILTVYHFLNYGINLFYKTFDLLAHNSLVSKFWNRRKKNPLVDVFLPTCGEAISILKQTFTAVNNIAYENKKIYVLDDAGDSEVKKLAAKFKFTYLSRPNKQEMKKAGNLLYGFQHSKGEFYAVFDADFAPNKDFIHELLPYMSDEKIGIVQSPQYFEINDQIHQRSPIEYGAANIQEDFYKIIQQARNSFGGTICVGSNALYRRAALVKIGGPTQVDHGEDVHTGIDVISAGYSIKYVPLILARGYCPNSVQSLYKQHNRWCSSSTGILLSGKVLKSNMTVAQKVCYYTGFLYYISQLFYFILPLQLFILLGIHGSTIHLINALPFLPHIVFGLFLLPLARTSKPKIGTYLANITTIYTHTLTVILRLFGRAATWVPTNTVDDKMERGFVYLNRFSQLFLTVYLLGISLLAYNWNLPLLNWTYYSVILWLFWNVWLHGLYFYNTSKVIYEKMLMNAQRDVKALAKFNTWRAQTISGAALSIVLLLTSFAVGIQQTNGKMLTMTKESIVASNDVQTGKISNKKEAVQPDRKQLAATFSDYTNTAAKGESLTVLARKAVYSYEKDTKKKLTNVERMYVESYLVKNHLAQKNLEIGDGVTFAFDEVHAIAQNSVGMSQAARRNWQKYAVKVKYQE